VKEMNQELQKTDQPKKNKRRMKITVGVLLLLLIGAGIYAFNVYHSIASTFEKTHQPLTAQAEDRVVDLEKKEPFSVLLLGVDQREGDRGRPDSMMLLSINPADQSTKMISIPRDTLTDIKGQEKKDKMNHSYTYGGIDLTIDTVEKFLDIPVDYYVEVDMDGFQDLVDAVGGVSVNNTLDFSYGGFHFPLGNIHLNGEEALRYSQMRQQDPNGDFGRQERQRKIIQAFVKEAAQVKTLANYGGIFEAISKHVKTNLTFDEIKTIQTNYLDARRNFDQIAINGSGQETDGVYYFLIPEYERKELSNTLKKHLEV
jgi:LCP family protein required for cell wall assembly